MTTNNDKSLILNRIKFIKKMSTDSQLAIFLGITVATLSNWRKRNSLDYDLVFEKCSDINKEWLINGNGAPIINENTQIENTESILTKSIGSICSICVQKDKIIELQAKLINSLEERNESLKRLCDTPEECHKKGNKVG